MKIGFLRKQTTHNGEELHGEIRSLQFQLRVLLVPNVYRKNDQGPDYLVKSPVQNHTVQVGAAWKKTKLKSEGEIEYLSVSIDDPSLPCALYLFAFTQNGEEWDLIWNRPVPKSSQNSQQQSA